ncbi:MAG: L-fucose/L-arabinose isomerase family protein [Oscillospiraceae bacterium]|jgi:L-fucose isomerase-like protein
MEKIKLGIAPTRRFCFSKEDAHRFKDIVLEKMRSCGSIEVVDIEDVNEEGLLYDSVEDIETIADKFIAAKVDALFFPHCNFGTEDAVAKVAKKVGKPVLLWGPRDEDPLPDGSRLRDTQCGLFATGKILRRFNVKFTYIPNCTIDDPLFARGFDTFLRAVNVVKAVSKARILQIAPRPASFWTMMYNEGELLETFGIQVFPITLKELEMRTLSIEAENTAVLQAAVADIKEKIDCSEAEETSVRRTAALKLAIRSFANEQACTAAAIQCWNALQDSLGIMPCMVNGLLTDEGLPVSCETDIHGAITCLMAQAAALEQTAPFFADLTVRHTQNNNSELLFHCGNFPPSLAEEKPKFRRHFLFDGHEPGTEEGPIRKGDLSIVRFDGDHGEYQLFLGKAKGIEGKFTRGTYLWIEVNDWLLWEEKLVCGPYVHHCVGIHDNVIPALYEACKYIDGLTPDLADPDESTLRAWMRGSI